MYAGVCLHSLQASRERAKYLLCGVDLLELHTYVSVPYLHSKCVLCADSFCNVWHVDTGGLTSSGLILIKSRLQGRKTSSPVFIFNYKGMVV